MNTRTLVQALESLGLTPRPYSGRGMYGRQCVGVDLGPNSEHTGFSVGVALALALGAPTKELQVATDSLGLGHILYFPAVPWPTTEREDEDTSDDSDDDSDDD